MRGLPPAAHAFATRPRSRGNGVSSHSPRATEAKKGPPVLREPTGRILTTKQQLKLKGFYQLGRYTRTPQTAADQQILKAAFDSFDSTEAASPASREALPAGDYIADIVPAG